MASQTSNDDTIKSGDPPPNTSLKTPRTRVVPPGFEIVKLKRPDGTIVRLLRPLPEESGSKPPPSTATADSVTIKPTAQASASTSVSPIQPPASSAAPASASAPKILAPASSSTSAPSPQPPASASTPTSAQASLSGGSKPSKTAANPEPQVRDAKNNTVLSEKSSTVTQLTSDAGKILTPAAIPAGNRLSRPFFNRLGLRNALWQTAGALSSEWGDIEGLQDGDEYWHSDSDDFDSDDLDDDDDSDLNQPDITTHPAADSEDNALGTSTQNGATHFPNSVLPLGVVAAARLSAQDAPSSGQGQTAPDGKPSKTGVESTVTKRTKTATQITEKEADVLEQTAPKEDESNDARRLLARGLRPTRYGMLAVLIILPSFFLVLAILNAVMTGRPAEDSDAGPASALGAAVSQANTIAVSAWPIVFAAIAAQTLRALATYRVERGIRLMTLEQLINSTSLASAIKQPFLLWRLDWTCICLLVLWCLSPVAGQAILRMSYKVDGHTLQNMTAYYMDTITSNAGFAGDENNSRPETNNLYAASNLPPGLFDTGFTDLYGNPLIPDIIQTFGSQAPGSGGWYDVGGLKQFPVYSSGYGITLQALPDTGSYNWTISSSYFSLNCSNLQNLLPEEISKSLDPGVKLLSSFSTTLHIAIQLQNSTQLGKLTFASNNSDGSDNLNTQSYSVCNFNQVFVDSNLVCADRTVCRVDKMRFSPTAFDATAMSPTTLVNEWLGTMSSNEDITQLEGYLVNSSFVNDLSTSASLFDIAVNATLKDFQSRLANRFNTYWQLGFDPLHQPGGIGPGDDPMFPNPSTIVTRDIQHQIYATRWEWLVILLISSVLLLLGGVASVIWDAHTIGPDVFGFANSVARRSKYIDLPKTDSTMDGPARARLLGGIKVMMQDVKPKAEVGKIALGKAHEKAQRLVPGRKYR